MVSSLDSSFDVASYLSSAASATVVKVNYRLSRVHQYPTPVHDVVRAYDWVIQHLVPDRAFARPGRSPGHAVRLGVCGELVGGGLATMLALTECRSGGPHIAAAAVNEPIVDWIFPEDNEHAHNQDQPSERHLLDRKTRPRLNGAAPSLTKYAEDGLIDTATLLDARRTYFRKPADYFDPFASPVLNFRSSGVETPPTPSLTVLDEFAELSLLERDDFHRQQLRLSALSGTTLAKEENDVEGVSKKTRKTAKRWPSTGSGLKIPEMHISASLISPLSDQAVDLTELFRRSIMAQHKKSIPADIDDWDADKAATFARECTKLTMTGNIQLWSAGHLEGLSAATRYLRETLG